MTASRKVEPILNEKQKDAIVHYYLHGGKTVSQQWIANHFSVHRKTVYNVLKERGVLLTKQERIAMTQTFLVIKELGLTPEKVRELAHTPALTPQNIVRQLSSLDTQQLMGVVYQLVGSHYMQEALTSQVMADAA